MQVIGIGTQDSFELAEDFVARHNLSLEMLWDPSSDSWVFYGVPGQPAFVVVSGEGEILDSGFGMWDDNVTDLF